MSDDGRDVVRGLQGGGRAIREPRDQIYDQRTAPVEEPAGIKWTLHTMIESLTAAELNPRAARIAQRPS